MNRFIRVTAALLFAAGIAGCSGTAAGGAATAAAG